MELRLYQKQAVDKIRSSMQLGNKSVILQAPCGAGKTAISFDIARSAIDKNKKVLFLANRRDLVRQTVGKYTQYGLGLSVGVIMAGEEPNLDMPIQVASLQTYGRRLCFDDPEYNAWFHDADLVIYDECVTPDTEILTDNGWEFINKININTEVAQYDAKTQNISFCFPKAYIKKYIDDEIISITGRQTDILATKGHEQPIISCTGRSMRFTMNDWRVSGSHFLPVAGKSISNNNNLTWFDRFLIMASADGCWVGKPKNGIQRIQFTFSKKRKIDRFLIIVKNAKIKFNETKSNCASGNIRERRRFTVFVKEGTKKGLKNIKKLSNIGYKYAKDFIDELINWDGSRINILYWSGTNIEDCNYIQAVCAIGGITCNRSVQIDNRKKNYKNVHRLTFVINNTRGCQAIKKTIIPYAGYVYCVSVPSGNIIIRRNGKVSITGNCHSCNAKTYRKIIELYKDRSYIIGLSATPMRSDGTGLGTVFDSLVECIPTSELIAMGHLVPMVYYAPSKPDLERLKTIAGDYEKKELGKRVDQPKLIGDIYENWLRLAGDRQTIIFATNVKHSKHIRDHFRNKGVSIEHIDAHTPDDKRTDFYSRFESGDVQVMTNVGIATEGSDFPFASCVVLARPTKQLGRYIQMAGRGARPFQGKKNCILLDHAGCVEMHGFIEDDINWTLSKKDKAAKKTKKREKKESIQLTCSVCSFVFMSEKNCPQCGEPVKDYGKKVESLEAELVKVRGKSKKFTTDEKRDIYAQLEYERRKRGYAPGWLSHKYKEMTGVWPKNMDGVPPKEPTEKIKNWLTYQRIKWAKSKTNKANQCTTT